MEKMILIQLAEEIRNFRTNVYLEPDELERIKAKIARMIAKIAIKDPSFSPRWWFKACGVLRYNPYALRESEVRELYEKHKETINDAYKTLNKSQFISVLESFGIDVSGVSYVEQMIGER